MKVGKPLCIKSRLQLVPVHVSNADTVRKEAILIYKAHDLVQVIAMHLIPCKITLYMVKRAVGIGFYVLRLRQ